MRISFTNAAGQSVVFSPETRHMYRLRGRNGFSYVPTQIQLSSAPYQQGATALSQRFDPRDITLNIILLGSKREQAERRRMMNQVFNPLLGGGRLHVVLATSEEYINDCIPDGTPQFEENEEQGNVYQEAPVDLVAPNPFWQSASERLEEMSAFVGGLSFPMSFPFSFAQFGDDAIIHNDSDVPAPVIIEFRGASISPTVINRTTGEFVRIRRNLEEGDVLEISTDTTDKYVRVNGENAMNYIDLESTFWSLVPGRNVVSYEADEGREEARVILRYRSQYVGI